MHTAILVPHPHARPAATPRLNGRLTGNGVVTDQIDVVRLSGIRLIEIQMKPEYLQHPAKELRRLFNAPITHDTNSGVPFDGSKMSET